MERSRVEPIGIRAVALAFAVALPLSLVSARIGVAVFIVMLGVAFLRATRQAAEADRPPPPPIPLRRRHSGPPRRRPGPDSRDRARGPGGDVEH